MKLEKNSETGAIKFTLSYPIFRENGDAISEVFIPPVLRLAHLDGLDMENNDTSNAPFYKLLDNVCGLNEAYARQLSLYDSGILSKLLASRMEAMKDGYNVAEE